MKYKKGFKYQLAEDYSISIKKLVEEKIELDFITLIPQGDFFAKLTIKKGYAWDGASGITIDTKSSMRGALIHDALYQLMRMELIDIKWRKYADELLRDLCIEDGMWRWRANAWYNAVQNFADFAADPKSLKKIIEV